ncbi:hypothetical protein GCM10028856_20930 [Halopiger thermotolerans]
MARLEGAVDDDLSHASESDYAQLHGNDSAGVSGSGCDSAFASRESRLTSREPAVENRTGRSYGPNGERPEKAKSYERKANESTETVAERGRLPSIGLLRY